MRTEVSHRTIFSLRADHGAAERRPYGIRLPNAVRAPHRFRVVLTWSTASPPRRDRGSRLFTTGEPPAPHHYRSAFVSHEKGRHVTRRVQKRQNGWIHVGRVKTG